jgi:hypothetical protein
MTTAFRIVLCCLGVAVIGVAQGPPPATSHYTAVGNGGELSGEDGTWQYYASFSETAQKGKSPTEGAWAHLSMCSFVPPGSGSANQWTCINADGDVPGSAVTITGAKLKLDIADVTALPTFHVSIQTCDGSLCEYPVPLSPWPLRLTIESTNIMQVDEDVNRILQQRFPDGTVWKETIRGSLSWTSAKGSGVAGSYVLPASSYGRITNSRNVYHMADRVNK